MRLFGSYRAKLQAAFLALGLIAIGLTGWEGSAGATAALQQATYDRLAAIRQTRCRQLERYFQDLSSHVLALSSDESAISALEEFRAVWARLPQTAAGSEADRALRTYYRDGFSSADAPAASAWYPSDGRVRTLQHLFIAANPHPPGSKDRLLAAPGPYGDVHRRYHPTLQRYLTAFGFYDTFLIDAATSRVLYTVSKEIDLGVVLNDPPYRDSALAAVFRGAMAIEEPEQSVLRDYEFYLPSQRTPAAFLAAPVWRAGAKTGVLAIQISIREVNRVMTGDNQWREEGLGATGQAYVVGPDGTLRSDLRTARPEVREHGTAILRVRVAPEAARNQHEGPGTESGTDLRGVKVLRSHARLNVPGLDWALMAEVEESEAFAPVYSLQRRIFGIGALIAVAFWIAAALLARSVTRPVLALAEGARRLGGRDFGTRLPVTSRDEIGQLAESFNAMAENLERTTVSKEELEVLAGRLITAQEDERRRIARELHDDLTQRMAAVAIEAGSLERAAGTDPSRWRAGLESIKQHMARLSDDIHGISRRLHPALLDDLGLLAAIEQEVRGFFERGGPPVDFSTEGAVDELPREMQLALYRIVQESLRNIQKHSGASSVAIRLRRLDTELILEIEDDGAGFDRPRPQWRAGLGLASMEERARLLGGRMLIQSAPGAGTKIEVRFPLAG